MQQNPTVSTHTLNANSLLSPAFKSDLEKAKHQISQHDWDSYKDANSAVEWNNLTDKEALSPEEIEAAGYLLTGTPVVEITKALGSKKNYERIRTYSDNVKNYVKFVLYYKPPVQGKARAQLRNECIPAVLKEKYGSTYCLTHQIGTGTPLYGRDKFIDSSLHQLTQGENRILFLKGAVGVGKKSIAAAIIKALTKTHGYTHSTIEFYGYYKNETYPAYSHFLKSLITSSDKPIIKQSLVETTQADTPEHRLIEDTDCVISQLKESKTIVLLTDFHCPNDVESQYFCTFLSRALKESTDTLFLFTGAIRLSFLEKLKVQHHNKIAVHTIKGLDEASSARILKDEGIQEGPGFKTLVNIYKENPAMLKAVAQEIKSQFKGSAGDFCELITHKNSILTVKAPSYYKLALQDCPPSALALIQAIPEAKQEHFTLLDLLPKFGPSVAKDLQILIDCSLVEHIDEEESHAYRINYIVRHLARYF